MDEKPSKLKMPAGVSSLGPMVDVTEAYMKAIIAIPEILENISESLWVIGQYFEKKGVSETLFTEEELYGNDPAD
jgi:hypothetical protein